MSTTSLLKNHNHINYHVTYLKNEKPPLLKKQKLNKISPFPYKEIIPPIGWL
jgi:hypothetical protein